MPVVVILVCNWIALRGGATWIIVVGSSLLDHRHRIIVVGPVSLLSSFFVAVISVSSIADTTDLIEQLSMLLISSLRQRRSMPLIDAFGRCRLSDQSMSFRCCCNQRLLIKLLSSIAHAVGAAD